MNISIVIPTYNSEKTIFKTIEACLNQSCLNNKIEVIVIDDGSTDNTQEKVQRFPVKYIYQKNTGPASARNKGWLAAQGEIICFTDSDCIPNKDWIQKLVEKFTSNDIGAVAGSYDIANKKNLLANCIHQEIKKRHKEMPEEIHVFGSYNVAIRRKVLEKTNGFNEQYRYASNEDNDLSYKILKSGYKISFAKDALVAHYHPEKLYKYLKSQYQHGYWRMKLYQEHPDMMKGDDYTNWKDIIEPPLALLVLAFFWLIPELIIFYLIIQMPMTLKIVVRKRRYKFFYLFWITFLRGFVRGLGMFFGGIRFFILSPS